MAAARRMILALSASGLLEDVSAGLAAAAAADRAGFDLILFGYPKISAGEDPLSVAAALIGATRRIGLVAAIDAAALAPFHAARALASLDLLSEGRAGWFTLFNAQDNPLARDRFAEHLDVVCALFDSWEDRALVFDKAAGVFADRNHVHRIRHQGRHFVVDGPLNTPRPVQGRPVILQPRSAGFAGYADIVISAPGELLESGNLNLQEVLVDVSAASAPRDFAAGLVHNFTHAPVDGFVLLPDGLQAMERIIQSLIPELVGLGVRIGGEGADLRARLGLARPQNRFAPPPINVP